MDFALFESLIAQLHRPRILRLNYSGESANYPRLADAVELAAATGAHTELVTALSSMPLSTLERIAHSRLSRLSVSIHTLDPAEFREVYGYSSAEAMRDRLEAFRKWVPTGAPGPVLDFAFVAMDRNLGRLADIAAAAIDLGVTSISIHPLLKRDPIPVHFVELDSNSQLTAAFRDRLAATVEQARSRHPGIQFDICNPRPEAGQALTRLPVPFPSPLPRHARIRTCEQDPWQSAHVLANGDVVACEVHDRAPLGNLRTQSLADLWHGEAYRQFRVRYRGGELEACRTCPWKTAYSAGPLGTQLFGSMRLSPQFAGGWHLDNDGEIAWSTGLSRLVLKRMPGASRIRLRGVLPSPNGLEVFASGRRLHSSSRFGTGIQPLDIVFDWPAADDVVELEIRTRDPRRPASPVDSRTIGFGLHSAVSEQRWPRLARAVRRALYSPADALLWAADHAPVRRIPAPQLPLPAPGLSVIIPERANPALLSDCLDALAVAVAPVREPVQVVIVVNGSTPQHYDSHRQRFPHVEWIWAERELGFTEAIARGLQHARFSWLYLLNSDMVLHPSALDEVLALRATSVFAVASQIVPADPTREREESNWTHRKFNNGLVEIFDAIPTDNSTVCASLYAGAGSGLFQRDMLCSLLDAFAYHPFYWEDAEWGTVARQQGFEVLFAPASIAVHQHRATISKFYREIEVDRIFERNRHVYQLRNVTQPGSRQALARSMRELDWQSFFEVLHPARFLPALGARRKSRLLQEKVEQRPVR